MRFGKASAVTGGPGLWTADLAEGWDIFGVTNGGYIMAIATTAMEAESEGRNLISASGTFLNAATAGPVEVQVEVLKRGRSLSTLRATVARDGRDLAITTAVFSDPARPVHQAELLTGGPPSLPPVADCLPVVPSDTAPLPPPFVGNVEMRVHPDDALGLVGEKSGVALMRGWFRLRDDEPMSAHSVVLATDAFPPAIFNSDLSVGWTPTIDLSVQVRTPEPAGWLACQFATRLVTDGMLEEDGEIWDERGTLVALSRQLALVPR